MAASKKHTVPADLAQWLSQNDSRIMDELFDFLRIPSISARSEHTPDVKRAAEWVHKKMQAIGFSSRIEPTAGHPIVLAEWRKAPVGAPTILIYGHYDVQPAEPLELWTSPAFEPTIRNGKLFARGSVDDKGQLWVHIKALEAHLATRGTLPVNIIVLAEGEEEVGSEHLAEFIEKNKAELKCDGVVISDSAMFAPGLPSILSSLRGLAYFEINVTGPNSDLHSGMYGGAVVNPAMALARILATKHDAKGRVAIKEAGLPARCVSHGLRKASMRRLAESDATANQIAAVSGHKTLKEVERYTRAADQKKLARSAIDKVPNRKDRTA